MLDAREVAPLAADKYMFVNTTASPSEGKHCDSNNIKRFEVVSKMLEKAKIFFKNLKRGSFFLKENKYASPQLFSLLLPCLSLPQLGAEGDR